MCSILYYLLKYVRFVRENELIPSFYHCRKSRNFEFCSKQSWENGWPAFSETSKFTTEMYLKTIYAIKFVIFL